MTEDATRPSVASKVLGPAIGSRAVLRARMG